MSIRTSRIVVMTLALTIALTKPSFLDAQGTPRPDKALAVPRPQISPADAEARARDSLAGLQWMYPVARNLSQYTATMCLHAIDVIDMVTRRRLLLDTVALGRRGDTVSTSAREFGKTCAAQWTPQTIPVQELKSYTRLALIIGDVPLALAALDRRVHEAPADSNQAAVLLEGLESATGAYALRFTLYDSVMRRMQSVTGNVSIWKEMGERSYTDFLQQITYDTTRMLLLTNAQSSRVRTVSPRVVYYSGAITLATNARKDADDFRRAPADSTVERDLANLQREIGGVIPDGPEDGPLGTRSNLESGWKMMDSLYLDARSIEGQLAPSFDGGFWFPAQTDTVPSHVPLQRTPGHVTLLISVYRGNETEFPGKPLGHGFGDERKAVLRHLHEKYASKGLDIILVDYTRGYAWGSPPLEPLAEAKVAAWYFHDLCDLPMPLVVFPATVTVTPDRRYVADEGSVLVLGQKLWRLPLLIGRDGRYYSRQILSENPWRFEAVIRQALGLPEEHL